MLSDASHGKEGRMPRDVRSLIVLLFLTGVVASSCPAGPDASLDPPADLPPGAIARIGTPDLHHPGGRFGDVFCLDDAGRSVLSVAKSRDAQITLAWWDVRGGRMTRSIQAGDVPPLRRARLFDRQRRLAGISKVNRLIVVDLQAGRVVLAKDLPVVGRAQDLSVAPDGNTLAVCGHENSVLVETASGQIKRTWKGLTGASVDIRPDGKAIAVATGQWSRKTHHHAIVLLDAATGEEIARSPSDWDRTYTEVRFAEDGKHVLAWARIRDPEVLVFDAETFRHVRSFRPDTPRRAVAVGGGALAMATDAAIDVWDLATGRRLAKLRPDAGVNEGGLAIGADGKMLATLDIHCCVDLRRVATDESLAPLRVVPKVISALAVEEDARVVWTGDWSGRVVRWVAGPDGYRMNNGRDVLAHRFSGQVFALRPAPALGGLVASARGEGVLIDMNESCRVTALPGFTGPGRVEGSFDGALTRGGRRMVQMDDRGTVRALDLGTGDVSVLLEGAEEAPDDESDASIRYAAFSADEQWAAIDRSGATELVHLPTGERIVLDGPRRAAGTLFGPFSDVVITARSMRKGETRLLVRELDSMGVVGDEAIRGSDLSCRPVFLGDGRILAVCSRSGRVRLVDICRVRSVVTLQGHSVWADVKDERKARRAGSPAGPGIARMGASPDGRRLVTAATDTTVLVWDVAKYLDPPSAPQLAEASLATLWGLLAQADASLGYPASLEMARREGAEALLAERLEPIKPASPRVISVLIAKLDSAEYRQRREAHRQLESLGPVAAGPLRDAIKAGRVGAESRSRVEALLDAWESVAGGANLRARRAVRVLERIGSEGARATIAKIAAGEEKALLTRAAKAALRRMKDRAGQ
jgi:WD40 repeat protein